MSYSFDVERASDGSCILFSMLTNSGLTAHLDKNENCEHVHKERGSIWNLMGVAHVPTVKQRSTVNHCIHWPVTRQTTIKNRPTLYKQYDFL